MSYTSEVIIQGFSKGNYKLQGGFVHTFGQNI